MKADKLNTNNVREVVEPVTQKKERLLQTLVLQKGHKLWSINEETGEIKETVYKSVEDVMDNRPMTVTKGYLELFKNKVGTEVRKTLVVEKDCYYIGALNKKNAIKNYAKLVVQINNEHRLRLEKEKIEINGN